MTPATSANLQDMRWLPLPGRPKADPEEVRTADHTHPRGLPAGLQDEHMLARLHQLALRAESGELAALSAHPQALLACLPAFCHILVGATRHLLSLGANGQSAAATGAGMGPDEWQVQLLSAFDSGPAHSCFSQYLLSTSTRPASAGCIAHWRSFNTAAAQGLAPLISNFLLQVLSHHTRAWAMAVEALMGVQSEAQFRHTMLPLLLEILDRGPASSTVGDLLCLQLLGMTGQLLAAVGLKEYVEEVRRACNAPR